MKNKFLLIGWDSADWDIINPLIDSGKMPHLEKFINEGVSGKIATLDPPLSPMLWTSIATGKRPYKHGILGFVEPCENGKNIQTVKVTSRKVKAVWNILQQNNLKSHVVGWWPSHPAEPISGIMVSNQFAKAPFRSQDKWELTEGSVNRKELEEDLKQLRVHPLDITDQHLLPIVKDAATINQIKDQSLYKIANNLAETATTQNVATFIMDLEQDWDFMGVYFESIDLICHQFMKYRAPKLPIVSDEKFNLYKDVVDSFYIMHDTMLGYMLENIPKDCTVMITSDHGFKSGSKRLLSIPKEPAAIAYEHEHHGFLAIKGPGIKKDERIYGSSILDLVPTVLHHFNLPIGKDMDGKPLIQIYEEPSVVEFIPSWENKEGDSGQHIPNFLENSGIEFRDAAHLDHLEDLGYIDTENLNNASEKVKSIITENLFYLGRSYHNARLYNEAIEIFEKLNLEKPSILRFQKYLADTYLNLNRIVDCKKLMDDIHLNFNEWNREWVSIQLWFYNKSGQYSKTIDFFSKHKLKVEALEHPLTLVIKAFYKNGDYAHVNELCEKLLKLNPNNHQAFFLKGIVDKHFGNYENAIDNFLTSIGLSYFQPVGHYNLALALRALQLYPEAIAALKTCLQQAPKWNQPMQILEEIYKNDLQDEAGFLIYKNAYSHPELPIIYIVSGLPRSGTSMMMQVMEACGITPLTDGKRIADENNLKGYYEMEAVKKLHLDNKWMASAENKVLKVVASQLPYLPDRFRYKIVFMKRDLAQVVKSQTAMLQRLGKLPKDTAPLFLEQQLKKDFQRAINWINNRNHVSYIEINYSNWMKNFDDEWKKFAEFLDLETEKKTIISEIADLKLFREK
jgi:predicted AlkP superfamily phosphohydrolase/phosphomutase